MWASAGGSDGCEVGGLTTYDTGLDARCPGGDLFVEGPAGMLYGAHGTTFSAIDGDDTGRVFGVVTSGEGGLGRKSGVTEMVSGPLAGEATGLGLTFRDRAKRFRLPGAGSEGVLFLIISSISCKRNNIFNKVTKSLTSLEWVH